MEYAIIDTAWGAFGYVARNDRLVATFLPAAKKQILPHIRSRWPEAVEKPKLLPAFRKQVEVYFQGCRTRFSVKLDLSHLPPFRESVLEACRTIPFGETVSYSQLAEKAGRPGAARAVGSAMASNPLPLVIPCHRVVRSDGSYGGFSSPEGVKQKEQMLLLENARPHLHGASVRRSARTTAPVLT